MKKHFQLSLTALLGMFAVLVFVSGAFAKDRVLTGQPERIERVELQRPEVAPKELRSTVVTPVGSKELQAKEATDDKVTTNSPKSETQTAPSTQVTKPSTPPIPSKDGFKKLTFKEKIKMVKDLRQLNKILKKQGKVSPQKPMNAETFAYIGFAAGILSVLFLFTGSAIAILSLLFAVAGLVFSILGLGADNKIFAILGLIFSILTLVIFLLAVILVASFLSAA